MSNSSPEERFNELKPYIGRTLLAFRRGGRKMTRESVVKAIGKDVNFMKSAEGSVTTLSFQEFQIVCDAIGCSTEHILALALMLKNSKKSFYDTIKED